MFDPDSRVEIRFNGRRYKRKAMPSKKVLLLEFAERFDRTFLPIAEVRVP